MARSVFDRDQKKITILVHTESIINDPGAIEYLISANRLSAISVLFMPIIHSSDLVLCEMGSYVFDCGEHSQTMSLVFPEGKTVFRYTLGADEKSHQEMKEIAERHILSGSFSSSMIDYIVTNSENTVKTEPDIPILNVQQCQEILRLFLVHTSQYQITEFEEVDESFYYSYKHRALFSEFQNYWSAVCRKKEKDDWAEALDKRLELISICLDKCLIEANKNQNNCTVMHLRYHVAYLILLVTGTFDNLAWIINTQYGLDLGKFDIDLRKEKFLKKVKEHSSAIYDLISNELFTAEINSVREVRDRIVHRQYIQTGTGGNIRNKYMNSYLFIDREVYDLLKNAGFHDIGETLLTTNEAFIHLEPFIYFVKAVITRNVNTLLRIIAEERYGAKDSYEMWDFLGFPCEPYVL